MRPRTSTIRATVARHILVSRFRTGAKYVLSSPTALVPPPQQSILYDSWGGKFSDHPRAIYHALKQETSYRHVWVQEPGCDGRELTAVPPDSVRHMRALRTTAAVVTNHHLPRFYRKGRRTVVLQTWHGGGTLKRVGFDLTGGTQPSSTYLRDLAADVAKWDFLLSTSPRATKILRSAFRFSGQVLEFGSPRNDDFFRVTDETRQLLRQRLRIGRDDRLLLYAPTFRDGGDETCVRRAVDELTAGLAPPWRLSVRLHPRSSLLGELKDPRIVDGNAISDAVDMLMASDALVTDYSSIMFDYLLTQKPLFLHCPDLEHYRDVARGFYLDFETEAPGVLVADPGDLVDAVRGSDGVDPAQRSAERQTWAPWDDGLAAQRVASFLSATLTST